MPPTVYTKQTSYNGILGEGSALPAAGNTEFQESRPLMQATETELLAQNMGIGNILKRAKIVLTTRNQSFAQAVNANIDVLAGAIE